MRDAELAGRDRLRLAADTVAGAGRHRGQLRAQLRDLGLVLRSVPVAGRKVRVRPDVVGEADGLDPHRLGKGKDGAGRLSVLFLAAGRKMGMDVEAPPK